MIQYVTLPSSAPLASSGWPDQAAFLAAPHVRIDGGMPISWQVFTSDNVEVLEREGIQEIWDDLKATGTARVGGGAQPEVVITGCGRPGSGVAAAVARVQRRDALIRDLVEVGLGAVTVTVAGELSLMVRPDRRGLVGRYFPREAVR